jgi:hypothetical protein
MSFASRPLPVTRSFTLIGLISGLVWSSNTIAQNVVTDWHAVMESTIPAAGRKNAVALPYYAYVDVAMYDAVSAIDGRYEPFAINVYAPRRASEDAAVAQAAHDVLKAYFPSQAPHLDEALVSSLDAIPDGQSKTDGEGVGKAVAAGWLALRAGDGLEAPITYTWGHGPGIWEPVPTVPAPPPNTPPAPVGVWMTQFKPFVMKSADQFLTEIPPPPALRSAAWTRDYDRTKAFGALDSPVRTAAQTEIGLFWTADAAAQYSAAFRGLVASQKLSIADSARLGAMYSVAASDAVTACMNAKYHFARWRPYTAITNGDTDANPHTVPDPSWVPLAVTPGHPEYPANHGCVTGAVMDAQTAFFETDDIPYVVVSSVTKTTHSFENFEDVVREVDQARIFGGMHFRSSVIEGNRLGRKVVDYMLKHKFHRQHEREE